MFPSSQVGVPVSYNPVTDGLLTLPSGGTVYNSLFSAPANSYALGGSSELPPGLSLNSSTGAITGTPTTAGTYYVMLVVIPSGVPTSGSWTSGIGTGGSPPATIIGSLSGGVGAGINWYGANWVVGLQSQTIAPFAPISNRIYAAGFSEDVFSITPPTSTSGLDVVLSILSGPATISGNTITLTGTGTVVVAANQTGNGTYAAAAQVTTSFVAEPRSSQNISPIASIPTKCYGSGFSGNTFSITAPTSTSGLGVVLSILSGPATISGNTITLTGVGTVVVAADQAGDATYAPALEVVTSFESVTAAVSISNLSHPFTDSPLPVTVVTTPPGLSYAVTYGGSSTPPTTVGSYAVAVTITDSRAPSGVGGTATLVVLDQISGSPFVIPCAILLVNLDVSGQVVPSPAPPFFKQGDDIIICLQFNNVLPGSTPTDRIAAVASGLLLQIRETPGGEVILQSDDWIAGVDTASKPYYLLHLPASGEGLLDAILDNYTSTGSTSSLYGQLFWNAPNSSGIGPSPLSMVSPVFKISIGNNLQ